MSVSKIAHFYSGKKVFLTGGSGFVGKCLAVKLLRSCPNVDKIYLLLRANSEESLCGKFQNLIHSRPFDAIRKENPRLLSKLQVVHGDVTKPLCGLQPDQLRMMEDAEVFIHAASAIHFSMRLPKIMEINAGGTKHVLDLAKESKDVKAVVYVSSIYSMPPAVVDEKVYPLDIEPLDALACFRKMPNEWNRVVTNLILKDKINTYSYSKHMAERLVELARNDLPVSIVRPGPIFASMDEPLPGWNETNSSISKFCKHVFSGGYHTILANTNGGKYDATPADYTVNTCLAAAWRLGNASQEFHVYNCVPDSSNSLLLKNFIKLGCETLRETQNLPMYYPLASKNETLCNINNYLFRKIPGQIRGLLECREVKSFLKDFHERVLLARAFKPMTVDNWELSTENMKQLNGLMNPVDRDLFPIDLNLIDWDEFMKRLARGLTIYDQSLTSSTERAPQFSLT